MSRYKKLDSEIIQLGDGQDPPVGLINPDYKQQPSNPRKCIECGKIHDTIVENRMTGERVEEIEKCKDCLFKNCFVEWGGTARCMTSDGRNINMAEELNRLERGLLMTEASTVAEPIEKSFDPFEEHVCKGGMTETCLVPGGSEFWLISMTEPKRFTWIEYCPYCGYRPPNLRWDWNNRTKSETSFKIEGTAPVKNAYFKLTKRKHDFPTSNKSTEFTDD